jgi:Ca2+-transporting ATPase
MNGNPTRPPAIELQAHHAHAVEAAKVLEMLAVDPARGLSAERVAVLLTQYGRNELAEAPPLPTWKRFVRQFSDLVVLMLVAASIIAGMLDEWTDSLAILAIVCLNAVIGFVQEHRAERALAALRRLALPNARVIRDGRLITLPTRELLPGDIVQLEAGDHVPADCRLLDAFGLRTQEATLTGESAPQDKTPDIRLDPDTSLGDRKNMAYLGTVVAAGKARAVVVATGMSTELGHIAELLQGTEPESTPLQRRLSQLGRLLLILVLAVIAIVFTLQILRGGDVLDVFMLSVSLAVAAVPEGLPAVVTIALALGLQRMVKRNALIRRLPSVETLGSVTVICTDKTGTLTRNEMTLREIVVGTTCYHVTGVGYRSQGDFLRQPGAARIEPRHEHDLLEALTIGVWCNNAQVVPEPSGDWRVIGDPTEGALLVAALKAAIEKRDDQRSVIYEIPFDSDRKMMSVVVRDSGKSLILYAKGAPEVILDRCKDELRDGEVVALSPDRDDWLRQRSAEMAGRALRVLAVAYRSVPHDNAGLYEETDLVFAGLVGMMDPPREEAREAVRVCHDAGIRPVMITGDHPVTALSVARELAIAGDTDRVLTGRELDAIPDEQLAVEVGRIAVYARVAAEHKLRVVRAWKNRGQVVAMTGDGVNDAPAIKAADIGIAMGVMGSDVTREASDMVLLDDNFASIVRAVAEGRTIYDNIQKVINYLLSSNTSEILLIFIAALLGWPAPVLAVQLLWINLVSDGFPALALAVEPPERDVMRRRPHPPHEPVVSWRQGARMLLYGGMMAAVGLIAFAAVYRQDVANLPQARTVTFCVVTFAQLFFAVSCRSQRFTLPELGLFSNPQLIFALVVSGLLQLSIVTMPFARPVFEVATALSLWEWGLIVGLALVPVSLIEIAKLALRLGGSGN